MPVIHFIQIHLQDLILAVFHLKLGRIHGFLRLTGPSALVGQIQVACKLLGQGAGPLNGVQVLNIHKHSAGHAFYVKSDMFIKIAVFHSQGGVNEIRRNLIQLHADPVLGPGGKSRNRLTAYIHKPGIPVGICRRQRRIGEVDQDPPDRTDAEDGGDQGDFEEQP
ncbi:hypothetical protein D3C87_1147980 [compost metagenome]